MIAPAYEITIDCTGFTQKKKKKIQKAFFDLGIIWGSEGAVPSNLNRNVYTNKLGCGRTAPWLKYTGSGAHPTHTYKQLMNLAFPAKNKDSDSLRKELYKLRKREAEIHALLKVRGLEAVNPIDNWKELKAGDVLALDEDEIFQIIQAHGRIKDITGVFEDCDHNDDLSIRVWLEELQTHMYVANWKFLSRPTKGNK